MGLFTLFLHPLVVGLIARGWPTSWHVFLSLFSVTTESGKVVCRTATVSFLCGKPKYQWRAWCVSVHVWTLLCVFCSCLWLTCSANTVCFYFSHWLCSHWNGLYDESIKHFSYCYSQLCWDWSKHNYNVYFGVKLCCPIIKLHNESFLALCAHYLLVAIIQIVKIYKYK